MLKIVEDGILVEGAQSWRLKMAHLQPLILAIGYICSFDKIYGFVMKKMLRFEIMLAQYIGGLT